ncbi:PP2C family protein-serine/threonine phosphatase [Cellulomonas fimi]|uniref:Protein serine/threonine phosphatase n=1 Tax=Cellulomonas fimi (strain ATCC 484 / DSM 20113 / JCM 1341 / CCUG 24087 / LMG 16345 / NBRC 15513 / NCIMB 8980 / NCTC 7547 / NRS-133) TaxID=590998 RepID=F4H5U8_CELFA|nr:PP2C family protein-serine/threonine phosphatase [Cellulomonas fimi]AEE45548.1 protein serine/threonine phosphatase [Cellulomonas fimi ATCC 484]NNH05940.1 serine/threonine-protein phosphatase [Cellulomonas fimi]VEH29817.1 Phosphoserine phosphatase rsbU [Cellulomonas fimi]
MVTSRPAPDVGPLTRLTLALRRRVLRSQTGLTVLLVLCSAGVSAAILARSEWIPASTFLVLLLVGVFLLRFRSFAVLAVLILVQIVALLLAGLPTVLPGVVVLVGLGGVVALVFASERDRLGLRGAPGGHMLVDLRDRLAAHGRVPALPDGWSVDVEVRPAHADAFSGDFMVARLRRGSALELVLVDVSGKGIDAGVRSLQLSGAFGGLLGALPSESFLQAANAYVLDQDWDEGFATAVHVAVDLATGDYTVASAGHPPPLQRHAGSGRLDVVDTVGSPALGVVEDLPYRPRDGRLEPGDVLLLYTDGLVDSPARTLDRGIDRLMGVADRVLSSGTGGAAAVLAGVRADDSDDRALVLVRRD